jgi:4-hydroxybenzoyl-CoA thioesterase
MPVRFADVDHAGIVYYPRFLHYFHVCFEEFFRERMGARAYVGLLDDRRIGFPSVKCGCEFESPLKFGDMMEIEMSVDRLGGKSVTFAYEIFRLDHGDEKGRTRAAFGSNVCAIVDLNRFRAVGVPEDVRSLLATIA